MASIEMLGGNEAVARRTKKQAKVVGEAAVAAVHRDFDQFVGPNPHNLTASQLELVAQRRRKAAMKKYKRERDSGEHNDIASETVGLRALIRGDSAVQKIKDWKNSNAETISFPELIEVGQAEGEEKLYMLHLPQGAFEETQLAVSFYPVASVMEPGVIRNGRGEIHEPDERFDLSSIGEVIRVEGYGGELWQSPYSGPDGASRKTPVKAA